MRTCTYSTSVEGRSLKKKLNKKKLHKEQGRPKKADRAKGTRWLKKMEDRERGAYNSLKKMAYRTRGVQQSNTMVEKARDVKQRPLV